MKLLGSIGIDISSAFSAFSGNKAWLDDIKFKVGGRKLIAKGVPWLYDGRFGGLRLSLRLEGFSHSSQVHTGTGSTHLDPLYNTLQMISIHIAFRNVWDWCRIKLITMNSRVSAVDPTVRGVTVVMFTVLAYFASSLKMIDICLVRSKKPLLWWFGMNLGPFQVKSPARDRGLVDYLIAYTIHMSLVFSSGIILFLFEQCVSDGYY